MLWDSWSKQSEKYDKKDNEYKWRSFEKNISSDKRKITFATVLKWCNNEGINYKESKDHYKIR